MIDATRIETDKRICHAIGNVLDAVRLTDSSVLDPRWSHTYNKDAHIEITLTAGEIQELDAARAALLALDAEGVKG